MFGLFKNKPAGAEVKDKVWMSRQGKLEACSSMLNINPDCLLVAWFEATKLGLEAHLNLPKTSSSLIMAPDLTFDKASQKMVVFVEHYPLAAVEQSLFVKLGLKEIPVLSSLDEPFFAKFGGGKLIDLMKKMGMKEDEVVGHSMVSKSIRRAQDAIAEKVKIEKLAVSQEEWFSVNIPVNKV